MADVFATFVGGPLNGQMLTVPRRDGQAPERMTFSNYPAVPTVKVRPEDEAEPVSWAMSHYDLDTLVGDVATYVAV